MPEKSRVTIKSAKGTIYFIDTPDGLQQGYDLVIKNPGRAVDVGITVRWGKEKHSCGVVKLAKGECTIRVYVPDVREPVKMTFAADSASLTIDHKPQRHWTVHLVQFAHHDLGYTDLPSNVLRDFCGFYDDVLRFCKETDHFPEDSRFRYTVEQGWSLMYYLENRPPEVCEEMMRRIKEGRIEVNAFFGNEITELLGSEEMVRMMYPIFALKRDYGIPVLSAEHNDIPGISWGVAAAMAGVGIRYFAPALPDYFRWGRKFHTFWDEDKIAPNGLPEAFYWEAPNGEKTLFWYGRQGAGGQVDVTLQDLPRYLEELEEKSYPYDVLRYLTMGGMRDNSPPRVEFAYTCREWNSKWAYPKFIESLNSRFFPELEKQLEPETPTYRGELVATDYCCAANCTAYPSSLNRVTHDQLLSGERIAALASAVTPHKYPAEKIREAYQCTLLNDEHAWGLAHPTGPAHEACIAQHCEYAYRAAALAHDVLMKSASELADDVSRSEDGYYAFLFNPLNWTRTDLANLAARQMNPGALTMRSLTGRKEWEGRPAPLFAGALPNHEVVRIPDDLLEKGFEVVDMSTGKVVPHEIYEVPSAQTPVPYAGYRFGMGQFRRCEKVDVRFVAEDVPPMGYKVYKFRPARRKSSKGGVEVGKTSLENKFYRIELDPKTGAISSIYDKDLEREMVDKDARHGANQVVIRSSVTSEVSTSGKARIEKGRNGSVSGSLIVKTDAPGYPQITQEIILYSQIKRIDIANRMLKDSTPMLETFFAFPFAFDKPKFKYEGSLSVIEPLEDQFPGSNSEYYAVQHWADVYDPKCGVAISSIDAPMMQFGGNWPLYISQAHHGVTPPNFDHPFHTKKDVKKGHIYSFVLLNNYNTNFSPTQNGDVLFRYSITSHAGDWKKGKAMVHGYQASLPLVHAALDGKHKGTLPVSTSFVQIDKPNVVLVAVKRAEDGNGLIVRLLETEGEDTEVTVTLPFLDIANGYQTNLVEENQGLLSVTEHSAAVKVKAWDTATLRLI